jgi:formylglycine-generating enzyme required for sulfatase activity
LPDDAGWGRGKQPVVNVNWDDARAYTAWLSAQTGARYRLPSEAEWEYAARGGSDNRFWWGYPIGTGNAICFDCGSRWDNRNPAPVGSLAANGFGLHDTAGNVMEWVEDCYHPDYQGAPAGGSPWIGGDCGQHMVRGGAYNKPARSLRSGARLQMAKDSRLNNLGFRIARDP